MKDLIDFRTPRDILEEKEVSEGIEKVLDTLLKREKKVLMLRCYEDKTFAAIGKQLGISPERIRQIEAKGFRKLRHPIRIKQLAEFTGLNWINQLVEEREKETKKDEVKKKSVAHAKVYFTPVMFFAQEEYWKKRIKFTQVYGNISEHPVYLRHFTREEKSQRIIAYKNYYHTDFEELKLIFNENDIALAVIYYNSKQSEVSF